MTEPTVEELYERRRPPFIFAAAIISILSVAIARLPDSLIITMERNRFLPTNSAAGWAYRLLAFFAIAQAIYGGFFIFRIDHVKRSRAEDPKVAAMTRARVVTSLSRNAAGMILLTFIYGLAALGVTGQRGGFWLFPFLCLLQGAWYFREIGSVARWLGFQPDTALEVVPDALWKREPPDYCPPLARTLVPIEIPMPEGEPASPN